MITKRKGSLMLNKFPSSVPWKDWNIRKTVWSITTVIYSSWYVKWNGKRFTYFWTKKLCLHQYKHWFIHYQCEHYMFLYKSLCYLYTVEPRWYGHQWVQKKTGRINGVTIIITKAGSNFMTWGRCDKYTIHCIHTSWVTTVLFNEQPGCSNYCKKYLELSFRT